MNRRLKFNQFLSCLLIIALFLGNFPVSVFASPSSNIDLTLEDVNKNQKVFSRSYMYNEELKTVYAYNTDEGTCKMTGDIIYSNGSLGNYSIRNEDGYLEFPFTIKALEVFGIEDVNSTSGFGILFLTTNNELRSFTTVKNIDEIVNNMAQAPIIDTNVVKLERNYYLTSDNKLKLYAGGRPYFVTNATNFTVMNNNTLKVHMDYQNEDVYLNLSSIYNTLGKNDENLIVSDAGEDDKIYSLPYTDGYNYLEFKYLEDGSLFITPRNTQMYYSVTFLDISNLKAISKLDSMALELNLDNATSIDGDTYTYSLFDGNVTLAVTMTIDNNSIGSSISNLTVSTSNNSKIEMTNSSIVTEFGSIDFILPSKDFSFDEVYINPDNADEMKNNINDISHRAIFYKFTEDGGIYWNLNYGNTKQRDDSYSNNTSYIIKGNVFKVGLTGKNDSYNIFIDFKNNSLSIKNSDGQEYVNNNVNNYIGENSICWFLEDYFNDYSTEARSFPTIKYIEEENHIIVTERTSFSNSPRYDNYHSANWELFYSISDNSVANFKENGASDTAIDWHYLSLYTWLRAPYANITYYNKDTFANDISILLQDEFGLSISTRYLLDSKQLDKIGTQAIFVYLNKKYKNLDLYNEFKSSWDGTTYKTNEKLTNMLSVNSDYTIDGSELEQTLTFDYLLSENKSFRLTNSRHYYYSSDSDYDYETGDYIYDNNLYSINYKPYDSVVPAEISLVVQSHDYLYSVTAPLEYNYITADESFVPKNKFYGLDVNNNLFEICFTESLGSLDFESNISISKSSSMLYFTKIADNIVKVISTGHYLASNGDLYSKDGTLVRSGVTNISDNLYQINEKWYYLDSNQEFKFNYASDLNLRPEMISSDYERITYKFVFNDDIDYVISPDGGIIKNGDTYSFNKNEKYTFKVINSYGDSFDELLIVNNLGKINGTGIIPQVLNGLLTLNSNIKDVVLEYSYDGIDYLLYTESVNINKEIYYRGTVDGYSIGTYKATLYSDGSLEVVNISKPEFNTKYFLGPGYILNGDLYGYDLGESYNSLIKKDVVNAVYADYNKCIYQCVDGNVYYSFAPDEGSALDTYFYRFPKIDFESDIRETVDIGASPDGLYAYLVGDSGNVVKLTTGYDYKFERKGEEGSYSSYTYYYWYENWLCDDVYGIDNVKAYKLDGTTELLDTFEEPETEESMLNKITNYVDLYKNYDIVTTNIKIVKKVGLNYYILTEDLDVYSVNSNDLDSAIVNNGKAEASYIYTIAVDTNKLNFNIESTKWTNSDYNIELEVPDYVDIGNSRFEILSEDTIPSTPLLKETTGLDTLVNLYNKETAELCSTTLNEPLEITNLVYYDYQDFYLNSPCIRIYDSNGDFVVPTVRFISKEDTLINVNYAKNMEEPGYALYTYTLPAGDSYTFKAYNDYGLVGKSDSEFVMINQEWANLNDHCDACLNVEIVDDKGNDLDVEKISTRKYSFKSTNVNGYNISIYDSNGNKLISESLKVANIDKYKPELKKIEILEGVLSPKFEDYVDLEGNFVTSGIYSIEYSLDDGTTWDLLTENGIELPSINTYALRRSVPNLLLKATDNATNESDIYAFNLGMSLNERYTYENGETIVTFYADDDVDWENTSYSYKYNMGVEDIDGYEFFIIEDTTAVIHSDKNDIIPISNSKDLDVKVVVAESPIISDPNMLNKVEIKTGNYKNSDFAKLCINIDKKGYTDYVDESFTTDSLMTGTHIIDAYYEVERDGQIIKSPEITKVVTVIDDIPIYHTLTIKDHFGSNVNIRIEQLMLKNSSYDIKALNINGWNIIGNDSYSGTITKDLVIDFEYKKEIVPPAPVDNDEPTIEPPKTGDSTNLSLWLIMLFISASILLASLFKRKRSI